MRTIARLMLAAIAVLTACSSAGPDGVDGPRGRLAFRSDNVVKVIELNGTPLREMPCHLSPAFSPGGSQIVCLGSPAPELVQKFQAYLQDLRARFGEEIDPMRLSGFAYHGGLKIGASAGTDTATLDHAPYFSAWWSQDGRRLLFQSGLGIDLENLDADQVGSSAPLYSVNPGGADLQTLSEPVPVSLDGGSSWSHDLRWKAAPAVRTTAGEVAQAPPGSLSLQQRIFLFAASGQETRQLTLQPEDSRHTNPSFSPDGRTVTYNATRPSPGKEGEVETMLYAVDFAGQMPEPIAAECVVADWSGDSQRLLLGCREDRIAVYDILTKTQMEVTTGLSPTLSPDEGWIAFVRSTDDGAQIRAIRIDGSDERLVTTLKGGADQLDWGR